MFISPAVSKYHVIATIMLSVGLEVAVAVTTVGASPFPTAIIKGANL